MNTIFDLLYSLIFVFMFFALTSVTGLFVIKFKPTRNIVEKLIQKIDY